MNAFNILFANESFPNVIIVSIGEGQWTVDNWLEFVVGKRIVLHTAPLLSSEDIESKERRC